MCWGALVWSALGLAACNSRPSVHVNGQGAHDGGEDGGGEDGPAFEWDGHFIVSPDAPVRDDLPVSCTPIVCEQVGGRYCGKIGDGCGDVLDCGSACPGGQTCGGGGVANLCGAPPDANCTPLVCEQAGGKLCGRVGNGCGAALDCTGACPAGQSCGGGGISGVCGAPPDPNCKPLACEQTGGKLCGQIGDGCGKVLDCGGCPGTQTCGGAGRAGVCGAAAGTCTKATCQQGEWKYCGSIGDGCGGMVDCTGCTLPDTCGGDPRAPGACGQPRCQKLCLRQTTCAVGATTSVSGVVVAPTLPKYGSADPIYNALVYVPNGTVQAFHQGLSCDTCESLVTGEPLVAAVTGADGKFKLDNVPSGDNVPLVIQIGKWRRQVVIPKVDACKDNPVAAELTRLPRNKAEGDIPQFALATGKVDAMECVLHKMGIDEDEFTPPDGGGRVHVYQQNGVVQRDGSNTKLTPSESQLWGSAASLAKYDIIVMPCRGGPSLPAGANTQSIIDYTNGGGRFFATHYSYSWLTWMLKNAQGGYPVGPLPIWTGTLNTRPAAADRAQGFPSLIDQSTGKGKAFYAWLGNVNALNGATEGDIDIHSFRTDLTSIDVPANRYIYTTPQMTQESVQQFDLGMPWTAEPSGQCGKVVFSDFHVAGTDGLTDKLLFSTDDCDSMPLRPQEKVLEFLLFDIASCVKPVTLPPPPPPPPAAPPENPPLPPPIAPKAPPPAPPPLPPAPPG